MNAPLSWELKPFLSLLALHQFLHPLYLALALGKIERTFEMALNLEKWLLTSDLCHAYFAKEKNFKVPMV